MREYLTEEQLATINREIELLKFCQDLSDDVKKVLNHYNEKTITKRIDTALKKIDPLLSYSYAYSRFSVVFFAYNKHTITKEFYFYSTYIEGNFLKFDSNYDFKKHFQERIDELNVFVENYKKIYKELDNTVKTYNGLMDAVPPVLYSLLNIRTPRLYF